MSSSPTSGVAFGRYVLLERVATGGMAEVFRAVYRPAPGIEKTVALKRVLPHLGRDAEFLSLFKQEAALGAKLAHANVVQLLDVGEVDGEFFLALEFVHGRNLRQILRKCAERRVVIPIALSLYIAMEAAKGLGYAHALKDARGQTMGIVHRDVSPANVLASFEGEVKVADFGIARALAYASTTSVGHVRGKASYLSPEQAQGRPLDGRSDQFSLGAILWELISGRRLFSGETETEIVEKVVRGPIVPVSQAAPGIPPAVDAVVMRALDRDPAARFPDAIAFSRALAKVLASLGPPIAGADLATWLRSICREEIEHDEQMAAAGEASITQRSAVPAISATAELPQASASPYADDLEHDIVPLPIEERRKLFDLPPPREAPSPPSIAPGRPAPGRPPVDEPLELVTQEKRDAVDKAVTRIQVGGAVANATPALRLGAVGLVTGALLFALVAIVYRH